MWVQIIRRSGHWLNPGWARTGCWYGA
jgi:hypothetical protein